MKKIKQSLDVRSLQMFVAVMESDNLTVAADKLGIKQSTITHAMDKLRGIFDDRLFVRAGRSVKPTDSAITLLPDIKRLLSDMDALIAPVQFEPKNSRFNYTIAANDFQSKTLLPLLYRRLKPLVKSLQLTVVPSSLPDSELLRNEKIDMVISPYPPENNDVMQRKLYRFSEVCFYDANQRAAPVTDEDFLNADYICPDFQIKIQPLIQSPKQQKIWLRNRVAVITNTFGEVAYFLRDSEALAIAPPALAETQFKGFSYAPLPHKTFFNMYLLWHKKQQQNSQHAWFREQLAMVAAEIVDNEGEQ